MNPPASSPLVKKRWPAPVRWALWVLLPLGLLIGSAAWWLWWDEEKARKEWEAYRAEAKARGDKIDLKDFLRPSIPDGENFAASPLFRAAEGEAKPFELPARVAKRASKMSVIAELDAVHLDFVKAGWIPVEDHMPVAPALWKALDRFAAPWAQLEEAAAKPDAHFGIPWEKGTMEAPTKSLWVVMSAARIADIRAKIKVVEQKPAEAMREWRMIWRLAQSVKREPTMMASMIKLSIEFMAISILEDGLESRLWTEAELQEMERVLAASDAMKEFVWNYSSDRAALSDVLLHIHERYLDRDENLPGALESKIPNRYIGNHHALVQLNRKTDHVLSQFDVAQHRFAAKRDFDEPEPGALKFIYWRRYALYDLLVGEFGPYIRKAVWHITKIDQARVMGALERHRLARGAYPEALTALVPEFLPSIPHDIFDGAPLRDQRKGEKVVVYSVGPNLQNDGGDASDILREAKDWVWGMAGE